LYDYHLLENMYAGFSESNRKTSLKDMVVSTPALDALSSRNDVAVTS